MQRELFGVVGGRQCIIFMRYKTQDLRDGTGAVPYGFGRAWSGVF